MNQSLLTRRDFLRLSGWSLGAAVLAACSPEATNTPVPRAVSSNATVVEQPRVLVGDVLDFALNGDWPGRFGFVKFKLNAGFFRGEQAYFIRTDSSDPTFAEANGLVYVPLLNAAQGVENVASKLYLFEGGSPDQLPVLNTVPSQENYSPLWQIHSVTSNGATVYDSEDSLLAAQAGGDITIEAQTIYVNYPIVKWPGGEMSVDPEKREYLGGGQCLEPVDVEGMTITMKLHECFPGSRYIVTDTSAAPMAPMMSVSASSPLQKLIEKEGQVGTDKIWVFANGIEGSGVMGFQPAIFAHEAGNPAWSPYWNHFTLMWNEGETPRVLKSGEDVLAALGNSVVEQFNGTPDTDPNGFVVNCPVPVLAPNTFAG